MEALSNCLRYDRFLRVLDISFNSASEQSLKHLIKYSLIENTTLVSLSAMGNPGLIDKFKKKIAMCLLKNIESAKNQGVEIKPEWIKSENLTFKVPQRILDSLGIKAA